MYVSTDPPRYTEEDLRWDVMYHHSSTSNAIFERLLPHAFQLLCTQNVSEKFHLDWIRGLRHVLIINFSETDEVYPPSQVIRFFDQCLAAGVVGTMVQLSRLNALEDTSASFLAIHNITLICEVAGDDQKECVCKELLLQDGFNLLVKSLASSHKSIERVLAGGCLGSLLSMAFLAEELTVAQVADLLAAATALTLQGHKPLLRDLTDPKTSYMREGLGYPFGASNHDMGLKQREQQLLHQDLDDVPQWFGVINQHIMKACTGAVCRRAQITKKECLDIIKQRPEILDNLLLIASHDGSIIQEFACDAAALVILCFLMMWPQDYWINQDAPTEFEYAIQCSRNLLRRPHALHLLMGARNKVCGTPRNTGEDTIGWKKLQKGGQDVADKDPVVIGKIQNAAEIGICTLRILLNLASLSGVSSTSLALLLVAYMACFRVATEVECKGTIYDDPGLRFEVNFMKKQRHVCEVRLRAFVPSHEDGYNNPIQLFVPPETTIGPTMFFRILKQLADEGLTLERLRQMKEMPAGTPFNETFSIYHVQQIVGPKVIGKLIRMSVHRRLLGRRELGNKLLGREPDIAREVYFSAIQLAQAISHFGMDPLNASAPGVKDNVDSIRRAYQEMVLCTGNACEAAAKVKDWRKATGYAQNAITFCDKFLPEDAAAIGWDLAASREKNARRLAKVSSELKESLLV